jgi:hypothetical protein
MKMNPDCRNPVAGVLTIIFLLVFALDRNGNLAAQTPNQGNQQSTDDVEAVPDRPTFSNAAETVQRDVLELEYGFELARGHQNINGLLRYGLTNDFEVRFGNNPIERDGDIAGFGDSSAGFKFRFLKGKKSLPTLSVSYTVTIPTAGDGLGSNAIGHSAGILASKDVGKHHLDFNETVQWVGRDRAGFDRNYFTALSYSYAINDKLSFSEEVAGFSRTNAEIGASLTILQALSYNVSPRLVIDGGCYVAPVGDLPTVTFFGGVTYAIGGLFRHLRHSHY